MAHNATRTNLLRVTPHVARHKVSSKSCSKDKAQEEAIAKAISEERHKPLVHPESKYKEKAKWHSEQEYNHRLYEAKQRALQNRINKDPKWDEQ